MTDLTKLTLAEARDGLRAKTFTSTELTKAFVVAIEKGNSHLNAYVLPTPEQALAMAQISDNRLARGEGRPLEGLRGGADDIGGAAGVVGDQLEFGAQRGVVAVLHNEPVGVAADDSHDIVQLMRDVAADVARRVGGSRWQR